MFGDGSLTLREFAMREPLPLATIHDAVLDFLRNRDDAVLFGAQAVNAYVDEPRMTQDVDILSTRARELAEEVRAMLAQRFTIAARTREVAAGQGFRVYQLREPKNRHLVDVRQVTVFPPTRVVAEVRVPTPEELIAMKVVSASMRSGQAKGDTDRRDLKVLLLAHPHLKAATGPVADRLRAAGADAGVLAEWDRLVRTEIRPEDDAAEFGG
ncbi:MAG TPA: nucleotidyl transferase AbiEii/AbiGii toxin family protein [Tepidisphaeraceae bacterium]|nr:nucleotidyl transferase AbiEii/AbiGii toxin family protein [Tepidisphaeraceae bacterium]